MDFSMRRKLTLLATSRAQIVRGKCNIQPIAPVDPIFIAEQRGCEVRFMSLPSLEGVYSTNPKSVIILGSQRPSGRRTFTCAHELGHHEFKHGTRLEELNPEITHDYKDPDEFLADMFAASLLMSQISVRNALKDRQLQPIDIEPLQVFVLASYFGVGYGTLVDHMTWTLRLLTTKQRKHLLKTQPRALKAIFGGTPQTEVILVDKFWQDRAVDLEIGDTLVLPNGAIVDNASKLKSKGKVDGQETFAATSKGYTRAYNLLSGWAINIRIASKQYEGLAKYRFLVDPEEDSI